MRCLHAWLLRRAGIAERGSRAGDWLTRYRSQGGAESCQPCSPGQFQSEFAKARCVGVCALLRRTTAHMCLCTSCRPCAPHSFSLGSSPSLNGTAAAACVRCSFPSFQQAAGASACEVCCPKRRCLWSEIVRPRLCRLCAQSCEPSKYALRDRDYQWTECIECPTGANDAWRTLVLFRDSL